MFFYILYEIHFVVGIKYSIISMVDVRETDAWVIVIKYSLTTGIDLCGSGNISRNAGNDLLT